MDRKTNILFEIKNNITLILNLGINDFKKRYTSSILGFIWAFIKPAATIAVLYAVFTIGLRSTPVDGVPFIVWMCCGLIPWFYISEGILASANSLNEYNFLVKKVVFPISVLPVVKIISSIIVHLFLVVILFVIAFLNGIAFIPHFIQLIYYILAATALIASVSWLFTSFSSFLKDFSPLLEIVMQIGMWATPIMWNYSMIEGSRLRFIALLNPVFYITEGFRESVIYGVWFFEKPLESVYFWAFVGLFSLFGATVFKKLRPSFADVL